MKTLYLDIFSGISGDMFLGAMIDLGVDPARLERELRKLDVEGYHLHVSRRQRAGIEGVRLEVHLEEPKQRHPEHARKHPGAHDHEHSHALPTDRHRHDSRTFAQIRKLIQNSALSTWTRRKATAVFERIAIAEGRIHGLPPSGVHFHEVGAVDSIVDIVGACIALEMLGKPAVIAAPVVEGVGWVDCAHGRFPVPAPATLAILGARGVGVTQCEEPGELVTPTGAALLAEFAERFEPMRGLRPQKIGFGLGQRENKTRPNVLRAVLGSLSATAQAKPDSRDWETDTVAVLETNLDDISPEILGHFVVSSLAAGALDVFHTPVQMKKNRPGILLTVICAEADADQFTELMLRETSAFGVRRRIAERRKLRRELQNVKTAFGIVKVKLGTLNGQVIQAAPEFESCWRLAEKAGVPVKQVFESALRALNVKRDT